MSGKTTQEILTQSEDLPHLILQDAGDILESLKQRNS